MGFNSAHLSDSTIKSFVDRLLKQNKKKTVDQWPPKRHQVQELEFPPHSNLFVPFKQIAVVEAR